MSDLDWNFLFKFGEIMSMGDQDYTKNLNYSPPMGNSGSFENYYYPFPYNPWYPYQPWSPPIYPAAPVYPAPQGWVCPVCGAANAPHVNQCPCAPVRYVWSSGTLTISGQNTGITQFAPSDTTTVKMSQDL